MCVCVCACARLVSINTFFFLNECICLFICFIVIVLFYLFSGERGPLTSCQNAPIVLSCVLQVVEDQLLVIGGYGGRHTTARVEMYDVYSDRWYV